MTSPTKHMADSHRNLAFSGTVSLSLGFVESLPYEWSKAVTSFDRLLRMANAILEDEALEIDQKISVVKSISDLTGKRLALFASPEILRKSIEHVQKLKSRVEKL
jgi:hypothetical protein